MGLVDRALVLNWSQTFGRQLFGGNTQIKQMQLSTFVTIANQDWLNHNRLLSWKQPQRAFVDNFYINRVPFLMDIHINIYTMSFLDWDDFKSSTLGQAPLHLKSITTI